MKNKIKALKTIDDLQPDPHNANRGTVRGQAMLEDSLGKFGAGRAPVADRNGVMIAGNKTLQAAADAGMEIIVVPTDGTKLVVVQRTDLDLEDDTDDRARNLAYADNRTSEVSLDWNPEVLRADADRGLNLSILFNDAELAKVQGIGEELDYEAMWQGMPEFDQPDRTGTIISVHFATAQDRRDFFRAIGQTGTDKTRAIWYPERPEELTNQLGTGLVYTDES